MRLAGKVAIVTGGASGIGKATVIRMAEEGASVVIADRNKELGEALEQQLRAEGKPVKFVLTDVRYEDQVKDMIGAAVDSYGRLDVICNNAGINVVAPITALSLEGFQEVIDTNLTGVFLGCKYGIEQMLKNGGGSVINTSSILGTFGEAGMSGYSSAKGAVTNLTRTLAIEWSAKGIRVNTVSPGYIETPLLTGMPPALKDHLTANHPVGRMGVDSEVANAIVFLASDEASFISGANLHVDGGYTAGKL